ncbi:MAG: hypothetical protein WHX93_15935 [bacterium]
MGSTKVLAALILATGLIICPTRLWGDDASNSLAIWVGQWLKVSTHSVGFCHGPGFLERVKDKSKGYLQVKELVELQDELPRLEAQIFFFAHGSWVPLMLTIMPVLGTNLDFVAVLESDISEGGLYLNGYVRMTMRRDERGRVILGAIQFIGTNYSIFSSQRPCAGAFLGRGKVVSPFKVPLDMR